MLNKFNNTSSNIKTQILPIVIISFSIVGIFFILIIVKLIISIHYHRKHNKNILHNYSCIYQQL